MPEMPLRFESSIATLAILPGKMDRIFACVIMICNPSSPRTPIKRMPALNGDFHGVRPHGRITRFYTFYTANPTLQPTHQLVVSLIYILLALSLGLLISNIAQTQFVALLVSAMVLLLPTVPFLYNRLKTLN